MSSVSLSNEPPHQNNDLVVDNTYNYDKKIHKKRSSQKLNTCGEFVCKIVKNADYIIFNNCELDFRVKCIADSINPHCNTWFCDNCFFQSQQ